MIYLNSLEETKNFATQLAQNAKPGDVITLSGDLGSGKTSLAQYFIHSLAGDDIEVTSPTFNLVHVYKLESFTIWHFDLYRLKNKDEIYELGIEDALNDGITLIEWPEIIDDILPKDRLALNISIADQENARIVRISK